MSDNPSPPGSRNAWWWAKCSEHGVTEHNSYLNGGCVKCQDVRLEAAGLLKPVPRAPRPAAGERPR